MKHLIGFPWAFYSTGQGQARGVTYFMFDTKWLFMRVMIATAFMFKAQMPVWLLAEGIWIYFQERIDRGVHRYP